MQLSKEISLSPPPFSDNKGNIIYPKPILLNKLSVIYIDDPQKKAYYVKIDKIPSILYLYVSDEYDKAGPINKTMGENRLKEALSDNPEKVLRKLFPRTIEEDPHGPGTVLSQMIKKVGIIMHEGCSCKRHAIEMNTKGNDWCEKNIDTIVGWLRMEANRRNLPFMDALGKLIVQRAIKKSRKLLANEPVPATDEELDNVY
jgi:hypothetical protein